MLLLPGPAKDVHVLSSSTRTWTELTGALEGQQPSARSKMGFAPGAEGTIYMFGGIGQAGTAPMQDLWLLNLRDLEW